MNKRWTVKFVKDDGTEFEVLVDEIDELQDVIERGCDWNELKHIVIIYNYKEKSE